jgi:hypothetical protein
MDQPTDLAPLTPTTSRTFVTSDDACAPCAHAALHGWWGPSLKPARSHCHSCHRSWASPREGHCTTCCRHFADVRAFDYHLAESGCFDPALARRADGTPRLVERDRPFGPVWCVIDYRSHQRPYAHGSAA